MKPYGIEIKDRRKMFDYPSDKFNSRGCFNKCNCVNCRRNKDKIRKHTARTRAKLSVINRMRIAKKKARNESKKIIDNDLKNN